MVARCDSASGFIWLRSQPSTVRRLDLLGGQPSLRVGHEPRLPVRARARAGQPALTSDGDLLIGCGDCTEGLDCTCDGCIELASDLTAFRSRFSALKESAPLATLSDEGQVNPLLSRLSPTRVSPTRRTSSSRASAPTLTRPTSLRRKSIAKSSSWHSTSPSARRSTSTSTRLRN